MPPPQTPVTTPVTFSFNNGEVQLISVIDPETTTINNSDSLPYHDHNNSDTLFVENLPECLIPQQILISKDRISCFLCEEEMTLEKMWNHMGSHILHAFWRYKSRYYYKSPYNRICKFHYISLI